MNSVKIKKAGKRPARRSAYHHGDLRQHLLQVAEAIILERGVDGFTLREAARRAGVSPAAPAHHFKDARGLLTEVALLGFRDFGAALEAADRAGGADPGQRLSHQAQAYVQFALRQPARFQLMFRHDLLDHAHEEFQRAAQHAYEILDGAIHAATATPAGGPLSPRGQGLLMAVWSMVHGFAHLALSGQLRHPDSSAPLPPEAILRERLPLMLGFLPTRPSQKP